MKKVVSILLMVCVLGSLIQFTIPLSWYITNYDLITTELCVNRNNPDIDCNGMCQLEKKMQQDHDHDHEAPNQTVDRNTRIDFFFSQWLPDIRNETPDTQQFRSYQISGTPLWISEPLSPPPQLG